MRGGSSRSAIRRARLKGVEIRPGSVRTARAEAGLSLAAIAGNEVTRAAIHLIENGRSRPSMPTLELIAKRTGRPVSYFIAPMKPAPSAAADLQIRVDELQLLCDKEDYGSAAAVARDLLASDRLTVPQRARALMYAGVADAGLQHRATAAAFLAEAGALFEQLGDKWLLAETLDWSAVVLAQHDDPRALQVAQQALDLCRSLDPVPARTEARILVDIAGMHLRRHEWQQVIDSYEAALRAAGSLRDLTGLARMHEGLIGAYQEIGDSASALAHSQRAIAINSVLGDGRAQVRTMNNLGLMLVRQGHLDEGEKHLQSALSGCDELNMPRVKSQVLLSLAELALVRHDLERARDLIGSGRRLATTHGEPTAEATAHQLGGRLAAATGDGAGARREFDAALALLEKVGSSEALVECHTDFAQVLELLGDVVGANAHWKEAVALTHPRLVPGAVEKEGSRSLTG